MTDKELEQAVYFFLKERPDDSFCKSIIVEFIPELKGATNSVRFNRIIESLISKGVVEVDYKKTWVRFKYVDRKIDPKTEYSVELHSCAKRVYEISKELDEELFRLRDLSSKLQDCAIEKRLREQIEKSLRILDGYGDFAEGDTVENILEVVCNVANDLCNVLKNSKKEAGTNGRAD